MGEPLLRLTKQFSFEASHQLPWHNGKCARLHGHSYVLEVTVLGPVRPDDGDSQSGMVLDFQEISDVVKPLIAAKLDHSHLNDLIRNSTAERLLLWLVDELSPALPHLERLRLYETATGWAEWRRE